MDRLASILIVGLIGGFLLALPAPAAGARVTQQVAVTGGQPGVAPVTDTSAALTEAERRQLQAAQADAAPELQEQRGGADTIVVLLIIVLLLILIF